MALSLSLSRSFSRNLADLMKVQDNKSCGAFNAGKSGDRGNWERRLTTMAQKASRSRSDEVADDETWFLKLG
ncbi:hypothetical protein ACFX2I_027928 [Malus domestica]